MNKTYKFIDLLSEIEMGNIKERTKIEMTNKDDTWKEELIYQNGDFITEYGDDLFETYTLLTVLHSEFTLIEEEPEEIDIQRIEELLCNIEFIGIDDNVNAYALDKLFEDMKKIKGILGVLNNKQNQLIQAVKQLDRKIKEEE